MLGEIQSIADSLGVGYQHILEAATVSDAVMLDGKSVVHPSTMSS